MDNRQALASYAYAQSHYVLERNFWSIGGRKSRMFDASGKLLFYCERKRFALKESMKVYADEAKQSLMLSISARSIIDFGAVYDVRDEVTNTAVGALGRKGFASIVRDEWSILDAGGTQIGRAREESAVLGVLRRISGPVSLLAPQTYDVEVGGRPVGTIRQNFNPFALKYAVDFSADQGRALDRRLAVGLAILLLNIEGRQR